MPTAKQTERRERIEAAAYEVLRDSGYKAASMLAVARRASSSNETLYNWYGNKQALFAALVEANAGEARQLLERALEREDDPLEALHRLGPVLLTIVTGEKAVTLNRAAAADVADTGTLGRSIAGFGRRTMTPLLSGILRRAVETGALAECDLNEAVETYIALLVGDLQIRRVIGVLGGLSPAGIAARAERAYRQFLALYRSPSRAADLY